MTSSPSIELGHFQLEDQTLRVLRAQQHDVAPIVALLADDVLGQNREAEPEDHRYHEAFADIDADHNQVLMVVLTSQNHLAATAQVTFIPGLSRGGALRAQVEAVRVADEQRGQGLGEAFFRWMIDYCTHRGATLLQLTTDRQRAGAARFYERLGFVASHDGLKLTLNSRESGD